MPNPSSVPLTKQGKLRQKEFAKWLSDNQFEEKGIERLMEAGAREIEPRKVNENLSARRFFLPGNVLVEYSDDFGFAKMHEWQARTVRQEIGEDPYAKVVKQVNDIASGQKPRTADSVAKVRKALKGAVLSERNQSDIQRLFDKWGQDASAYNRIAESASPELAAAVVNASRLGNPYYSGGRGHGITAQYKTMAEDLAGLRDGDPDNMRNNQWHIPAYDSSFYRDEESNGKVWVWKFIDGSTAVITGRGVDLPGVTDATYPAWDKQPDIDGLVAKLKDAGYYESTSHRYIPDGEPQQVIPPRTGEEAEPFKEKTKRIVKEIEDRMAKQRAEREAKPAPKSKAKKPVAVKSVKEKTTEKTTKAASVAKDSKITLRKGKLMNVSECEEYVATKAAKGRGGKGAASSGKRGGSTKGINIKMGG